MIKPSGLSDTDKNLLVKTRMANAVLRTQMVAAGLMSVIKLVKIAGIAGQGSVRDEEVTFIK